LSDRKASRPAAEFSARGPRETDRLGGAINFVATSELPHVQASLAGSDYCAAEGLAARGPAPVLGLCQQLLDAGFDPATPLQAYRDDKFCLSARSIGEASKLEINGKGTGFRRGRQAVATASPIRQNKTRAMQ